MQVLEATLRLLAREGPRAVTHRAVAREAGTSVRATTYYFDSRETLLIEALQHYADTAVARFDELGIPPEALRPGAIEAGARMLADTVLGDLNDPHLGVVAEYELVLEVGRNPALEGHYRRWQERLEMMIQLYARVLGSPDPVLDARIALAAIRGLEIEALARPSRPADRVDLERIFRRLLTGMLAPLPDEDGAITEPGT